MPELDVETTNASLAGSTPEAILRWSIATFGDDVVATSSFQTQSLPLLHMISRACPRMPVLFLDTGFHFPETIAFRDYVVTELRLELRVLTSRIDRDAFIRCYGTLYRTDPDLCCYLNKVEPLANALAGRKAWIAGIRNDQTEARRATRVLERGNDGLFKVSPLASWTAGQVEDYRREHGLPEHPLTRAGYPSIGCKPCTRAVTVGADARSGRWAETEKSECGIHEDFLRRRGDPGSSK